MRKKIGFVLAGIFLATLLTITWMPATAMAGPIKLTYANFPPAPTFPCVQMEKWKKNCKFAASELTWENEEKVLIDIYSKYV